MFSDDDDRELREEFGGLWLAGCVMALCGVEAVVSLLQRISRRLRG